MENNLPPKKNRGIKYIVLAVLVVGAVWFTFLSKDRIQTEGQQADVKEAASSMVAGSKQQGENLMVKASEMKDSISDTMTNGRNKVSELASNFVDKTDHMAKSATETGTEWVDSVKSAVSVTDATDSGATQSIQLTTQASKAIDSGASQVEKITSNASDSLADGLSGAKDQFAEPASETIASGASELFNFFSRFYLFSYYYW